jgi:uncharacterized membrane protein YgcG
MLFRNKLTVLMSLLGMMMIFLSSAHAEMVGTDELLQSTDRTRIVQALERKDVQQQLTQLGVDPDAALARVDQMTDSEISQINGRLAELPAGGGVTTVELLLIIIIVLLIV